MDENGAACNAAKPETPVDKVIRVFGWPRACEIAKRTPAALIKWNRGIQTGGGGGLVPVRLQHAYLEAAKADGLPLTAQDLIAEARP